MLDFGVFLGLDFREGLGEFDGRPLLLLLGEDFKLNLRLAVPFGLASFIVTLLATLLAMLGLRELLRLRPPVICPARAASAVELRLLPPGGGFEAASMTAVSFFCVVDDTDDTDLL